MDDPPAPIERMVANPKPSAVGRISAWKRDTAGIADRNLVHRIPSDSDRLSRR